MTNTASKVKEIFDNKRKIAALTAVNEALSIEVIAAMEKQEEPSIDVGDLKCTLVAGSRIVIDETKLKKRLGARAWNLVTNRVLDRQKLEEHMADSTVDVNVVADCSEEVQNKPYLKLTQKKDKKPDLKDAVRHGGTPKGRRRKVTKG